jgi:hypothetical protein
LSTRPETKFLVTAAVDTVAVVAVVAVPAVAADVENAGKPAT